MFLTCTLSVVSQLSTHHSGISFSPRAITHSTPLIVHADLHSAFILYITSCQSKLTSCTRSWMYKQWKAKRFLAQLTQQFLWNIPSHPTPASSEWRQLCDRIFLVGHPKRWLELEVHWTSSRNIDPLPTPKWALMYALPPAYKHCRHKLVKIKTI